MGLISNVLVLPPNRNSTFKIYMPTTCLAVGVLLLILGRLQPYIECYPIITKWLLLLVIIQSKLPVAILYWREKKKMTLSSLQIQSRLSLKQLLVPSILKLVLIYSAFSFLKHANSLYKIPLFATSLLGLEVMQLLQANSKARKARKYRTIGIFALLLSDALGCYETHLTIDLVEYIGCFILVGVSGIGVWTLNRKLFDMYKCDIEQVITKTYLLEVLLCLGLIVTNLIWRFNDRNFLMTIFKSSDQNLSMLSAQFLILTVLCLLALPVAQCLVYNAIWKLDLSQSLFTASSSVFWLRIWIMCKKQFSALAFLSLFCIATSYVYYFGLIRYRQLVGFVELITGKLSNNLRKQGATDAVHSMSLEQYPKQ